MAPFGRRKSAACPGQRGDALFMSYQKASASSPSRLLLQRTWGSEVLALCRKPGDMKMGLAAQWGALAKGRALSLH
jgi:hypothetical protein